MTIPPATFSANPERSSKALRFLVGLVLTTSVITVYTAVAYWLGFRLINYFAGSFLGFAVGVWLGTPVMYALNFFRPRVERAIIEDFEEIMLLSSD
jgi:hypothetical protein